MSQWNTCYVEKMDGTLRNAVWRILVSACVEEPVRCQPAKTPLLAFSERFLALPWNRGRSVAMWSLEDVPRQVRASVVTHISRCIVEP